MAAERRGDWGAPTGRLTPGNWPHGDPVEVVCPRCGRAGRYRLASLLTRFGPDAAMPDILRALADCPDAASMSDPCQVRYRIAGRPQG